MTAGTYCAARAAACRGWQQETWVRQAA
jgi:hypothetical protein